MFLRAVSAGPRAARRTSRPALGAGQLPPPRLLAPSTRRASNLLLGHPAPDVGGTPGTGDALVADGLRTVVAIIEIVTVCTGNICRSPMAGSASPVIECAGRRRRLRGLRRRERRGAPNPCAPRGVLSSRTTGPAAQHSAHRVTTQLAEADPPLPVTAEHALQAAASAAARGPPWTRRAAAQLLPGRGSRAHGPATLPTPGTGSRGPRHRVEQISAARPGGRGWANGCPPRDRPRRGVPAGGDRELPGRGQPGALAPAATRAGLAGIDGRSGRARPRSRPARRRAAPLARRRGLPPAGPDPGWTACWRAWPRTARRSSSPAPRPGRALDGGQPADE
ncbi:hypothetical protein QJS66_17995 [Kocuria rhizophila]|nr:hypothetical protein QJS66_17995 [Kocuria rhizophila]